jgi:hypothetical protein
MASFSGDRLLPRVGTISDLVAIVLLIAASGEHLVLLPEHFEESMIFGLAFLLIALFQFSLALALWWRPGDRVRTIGRWGSLAIVTVYVGARIVVPPGGTTVEEVDWRGILSVALELSTVAALAVGLPVSSNRPSKQPGIAAATAFILLSLLAAGGLSYSPEPFDGPPRLFLYGGGPDGALVVSTVTPAEVAFLPPHWSLYLPIPSTILTILVGLLLGYAVYLTVVISTRFQSCRVRFGLLGAAPAVLAAPVCCGPSLASLAGIGVAAALGTLALPLLVLSALLLSGAILWQRRILRVCGRHSGLPPEAVGRSG